MSIPASHSPVSPQAALVRAVVPPYAAPASSGATLQAAGSIGPFVPQPWRSAFGAPAATAIAAVAETDTGAVSVAASATAEVASIASETEGFQSGMEVPTRIPPYRPLRPTPIMTAAVRTPLYIPTVPTPVAEAAVAEVESTESPIVHDAERVVPASDMSDGQLVDDGELPWIDAYLASTPVVPVASVATPVASSPIAHLFDANSDSETGADAAEETIETASAEAYPAASAGATTELPDAPSDDAASDVWPLNDAMTEFRSLSAQLESAVKSMPTPDELFAVPSEPEPLAAWSDDDMMDIMPIRHSGKTPLSSPSVLSEGELWSERARKAQDEAHGLRAMASSEADAPRAEAPGAASLDASAEEAAQALEVLARRVRAGELTLPGYDPRTGESAALVAALAAILGVRFR